MKKMNEKVKAKWLAALRSGKYGQTRDKLRYKNNFCCLGVLCDLHSKETGTKWLNLSTAAADYCGADAELPPEVQEWAGLSTDNPPLRRKRATDYVLGNRASAINDGGATFSEIADLI